jgi:hypothetical protein
MDINDSLSTLYHRAEQLDNRSLDTFIENVISLRVRREMPNQQVQESILLKKINKNLPVVQIERFRYLNEKRLDNTLTEIEYSELLILLEKIEKLNTQRIKPIAALAQLRNVTTRELIKQLGISNQSNA